MKTNLNVDTQGLREKILDLAMRGKLVEQDAGDEPASALLEKIKAEKAELVKKGKIKKSKKLPEIIDDEKPFDIPNSWEWVRLGDVLDVRDGTHDTPKYITEGVPLITSKNIRNGYLSFEDVNYISEEDSQKIDQRSKVDRGDIIFAMIGSIGNPVIINTDMRFCIKNVALLKHFTNLIDMNYVLQCMHILQTRFNENASGAVQKFISLRKIREQVMPLPPLAEQKRIANKVSELFKQVDVIEKNVAEYQDLEQAMRSKLLDLAMHGKLVEQDPSDEPASELLKQIQSEKAQLVKEGKIKKGKKLPEITDDEKPFDIPDSWKWVRLGDVTLFGNFKSVSGQDIPDGSWILDMENMNKNGGGFNKIVLKQSGDAYKSNKYEFKKNDVLYGKLRPYLMKVEVAGDAGYSTTEMFPIRVVNEQMLIPKYLRYCLLSPKFVSRVIESSYGMKMPRVGTTFLAKMLIPLPPLEEQKRIVAKLEELFEQLDIINNNLVSAS